MRANCKIVFVASVEEGRECLQELIDAGGDVVAILTFTDEIARRTSGAVSFEEIAGAHAIPLYKVKSTNTPQSLRLLRELAPDVIFVIGWTRLVSSQVLAIPRHGCIGMHASLLPKYRGRAPVNWALINNEEETGNTAMLLDAGVDTGRIVAQRRIPINRSDTCRTVYQKVSQAGRNMIGELLQKLEDGHLPQLEQNDSAATTMPKRTPEDGVVDWHKTGTELFNWVRALTHPYPGAFTFWRGVKIHIWEARLAHYTDSQPAALVAPSLKPGTVLSISDGIAVLTGQREILTLHRLSYDGQQDVDWRDFLTVSGLQPGHLLGA